MRLFLFSLLVLALSFSLYNITVEQVFDLPFENATTFAYYGDYFYVINDLDGYLYQFSQTGSLKSKIKTENVYVFDLAVFDDALYYVSDLGLYKIRPSKEVVTKTYGLKKVLFTENGIFAGTTYHSLNKYDEGFSLVAKIGGYNKQDELVVDSIDLWQDGIVVGDALNKRAVFYDFELNEVRSCYNITKVAYNDGFLLGFFEDNLILMNDSCGLLGTVNLSNVEEVIFNTNFYVLTKGAIYKVSFSEVQEEEVFETVKNETTTVENKTEEKEENKTPIYKPPPDYEKIKEERKEEEAKKSTQLFELSLVAVLVLGALVYTYYVLTSPKKIYKKSKRRRRKR